MVIGVLSKVIAADRKGDRSAVNILHSTMGRNKKCWMVPAALMLEPRVGPGVVTFFPHLDPLPITNQQHLRAAKNPGCIVH